MELLNIHHVIKSKVKHQLTQGMLFMCLKPPDIHTVTYCCKMSAAGSLVYGPALMGAFIPKGNNNVQNALL